jgi:uncharacterized protein
MSHLLITGAAGGLGRSLAIEAHRRGHQLSLVDVSAGVADVAAATGARYLELDLAGRRAPDDIVAWAPDVDVVINNAGVAVKGAFRELTHEQLERVVDVNVRAPLLLTRKYLEQFHRRGRGTIVNVSSSASHFPTPGLGPYGASKAFLTALSETLESEIGATDIRVLCVCPAGMATGFQQSHGIRNEQPQMLLDPDVVARWCLDDIEQGRSGVRDYGRNAHLMRLLRRLLPRRLFVRVVGNLVSRHR